MTARPLIGGDMRPFVLLVAFCLLNSSTTAIDSGQVKNGFWWNDLPSVAKIAFIEGYVEGLSRADSIIEQTLRSQSQTLNEPITAKPVRSFFAFSRIAFGQFRTGLDEFYKDYRNQRINFNVAILYVRDQIKGESQDNLEKRLE